MINASVYLQPIEYSIFGAPSADITQVIQASVLIDAYLCRPQGLVCVAGGNGLPAYMAALAPELTFASIAAFSPGVAVQVQVSGPLQALQVGDCVVLDRINPAITEAAQITAISGTSITLAAQFAHAAGCAIETGLMISEARYLPRQRSEVTLACVPVARIVGGTGRYSYGRRGDAGGSMSDFNLLAAVSTFGGPPAWEIWPANAPAGIDARTGRVWVPAGVMLAYYSEVNIRYVAGYTYANLPSEIKLACAKIANSISQDSGIGNFKSMAAGDTKMERFAASHIDADVKAMLQPWRARAFA